MNYLEYKVIVKPVDDSASFESDLNTALQEDYTVRTGPEIRYAPHATDKDEGVLFAFLSKNSVK